ncbi:MAG: VWA domain-containing protein [Corynebacterium sp.]|nr:VWA domain-containing protein [Corynebacterium sp.]
MQVESSRGRVVGPGTEPGVHLMGTIAAAAQRGARIRDGRVELQPEDLQGQKRVYGQKNLIIFLVDASGSMAARDRLATVTGAVVSLLDEAYKKRDQVAVISVRGAAPEIVLEPTGSVDRAVGALRQARTGGKTPLVAGMREAAAMARRAELKDPAVNPIVVIVTDGRATDGKTADAAAYLNRVHSVVVDSEKAGRVRLGLAGELARALDATYVTLDELRSGVQRIIAR